MRIMEEEIQGRKIPGFEGRYYITSEAAKLLSISTSYMRNCLTKKWLDGNGVERSPEDVLKGAQLEKPRKFISEGLVDRLRTVIWTPVG